MNSFVIGPSDFTIMLQFPQYRRWLRPRWHCDTQLWCPPSVIQPRVALSVCRNHGNLGYLCARPLLVHVWYAAFVRWFKTLYRFCAKDAVFPCYAQATSPDIRGKCCRSREGQHRSAAVPQLHFEASVFQANPIG